MDPVSTWMESFPMWLIPARVKSGEVLPMDAPAERIDAVAEEMAEATVGIATAEGYALVMPTARITVEPHHDGEHKQDGLTVQAWCQAVRVTP